MLQRAIANLFDNAIKYTPPPGHVDVRVFRDAKHEHKINISVKDSGIGIDNQDLSKIFNRFFRCDQSRTASGSGLGLSLAQAIARAHHGEIRVVSVKGEGSVFTLNLPDHHTR
jgi:signal transduction histidine kinase